MISSLTVNDLPAHDVARTMLFILGRSELNLSKITNDHVCKLIPYKIPVLVIKSDDTKGKLPAIDDVIADLVTPMSSLHNANVALKPSSILWIAGLIRIPIHENTCSSLFPNSVSLSCSS